MSDFGDDAEMVQASRQNVKGKLRSPRAAAGFLGRRKKSVDRGEPPIFLQVLIPGGFKSNDFASADSKAVAETFFVTAYFKRLASAGHVRERHVVRVHRFGKALGGLCSSCSLVGITMSRGNCPQACAATKKMRKTRNRAAKRLVK